MDEKPISEYTEEEAKRLLWAIFAPLDDPETEYDEPILFEPICTRKVTINWRFPDPRFGAA